MEKPGSYSVRDMGIAAANENNWVLALMYLNRAARQGARDIVLLDLLGEAAYRNSTPEALGPYQNYYKYPSIASHMARAFLMLGDVASCREFLGYAKESALKAALHAMLVVGEDMKTTANQVLPVAVNHPNLEYPEYWRALAAVADAVGNEDLTHLAERRSKALAYGDPNIHFNQALRMLGKGELRAGWRLYEWRLVPGANQSNRTELGTIPMWEGESLEGKTLLVCFEQGLGDCLFAMRYLQTFLDRGVRLEVVARPGLIPVIQESYPQIKIHDEDKVAVVDYWDEQEKLQQPRSDFWVYGLSIPYRAGLWQPINTKKFLSADAQRVQKIRQKLNELNKSKLPVYTINWHGRIDTEADRSRAFSVPEFLQVTGLDKNASLIVSLQKDITPDEASQLEQCARRNGGVFINAGPELESFAVTAAWIEASDHLWTCDTSVAHLGGGLGHPTTVCVRNRAIWQWRPRDIEAANRENGGTSLWYESARIQYSLAPEVSWHFTTFSKDQNKDQSHEHNTSKNVDLQSTKVRPSGLGRAFRFAGRSEQ